MKTELDKDIATFKLTGDWKGQSKLLRSKFTQLTAQDLLLKKGQEEALIKRMAFKLNKNVAEIISILERSHSESLVQ